MKAVIIFISLLFPMTLMASPVKEVKPTPQTMYLSAGEAERTGRIEAAKETYRQIIDRFPDSPLAVKASDRLLQINAQEIESENARKVAQKVDEDRRAAEMQHAIAWRAQAANEYKHCMDLRQGCMDNCMHTGNIYCWGICDNNFKCGNPVFPYPALPW